MKLSDAEAMCKNLMRHHGVFAYEFKWMERRKNYARAGQCYEKKKLIMLQPTFVELNYPVIVKRTILHEIAHAIVGAKHDHNKFWKRCAQALGHTGNRCYGKEVKRS